MTRGYCKQVLKSFHFLMKEDINSVTKGSEWQLHVHGTLFYNEVVSGVTVNDYY